MDSQRSPSHIASSSPHWTYEVFLSFRGEDTRKNFTDHLYAALERRGVIVFKDDKELDKGKSFSPGLCRAIEESRISVIVFSKNYASSTWCLDELIKILQCMKTKKQTVIPIFYNVDPSVVRKQTANYQEAFAKHLEVFKEDTDKVQNWRTALEEVTNLIGWVLKDGHESKFIQDIVEQIAIKLSPATLRNRDNDLVGLNSRLEKLMKLLTDKVNNDVSMIGIYGMGGIGKTTLARVAYQKISYQFEASSFLANVRENSRKGGLVSLQKQLLSEILIERDIKIRDAYEEIRSRLCNKKVLIVIDDVDDIEQLNELVGKHGWFGSGSRIMITSRDKHLLVTHGVDKLYKAEELDGNEALQLFNSKAFKNNKPFKKHEELSKQVVKYASGHPLTLKVIGCFLFDKTIEEWESALQRLGKDSERNILDCLQISFDGLKETEKKIFLDIACFFKGERKDRVTRILDCCNFDPTIGLRVLEDKCLLTITYPNILCVHDLLQELGQKIVEKESPNEPGKRSRLWGVDALNVLTKNMGTEVIEGIILEKEVQSGNAKVFSMMTNLRLLKMHGEKLSEGLEYVSSELRLLEWDKYGLKSLPSSVQLDNIVEIIMHHSRIEELWEKIKPINTLKIVSLSHSKNLKKTPDLTNVPNLEELILEGCTSLHEIHPSLFVHKKLILLNLKDCTRLTTLPYEIDMKSLKTLDLSGCLSLKKFPEIMPSMDCLSELFLDRTSIKELPMSFKLLTGLVSLSLEGCSNLRSLPSNINDLKSLTTLNLSGLKLENVWQTESVEELDIRGTARRQQESNSWYSYFPFNLMSRKNSAPMTLALTSLSGLCSLVRLELRDCNLRAFPSDIGNLGSLYELDLSGNSFVSLPASMNHLSNLVELNLNNCKRLQSLPELPSRVSDISAKDCASLETLSNALKLPRMGRSIFTNCFKLRNYSNDFVAYALTKEIYPGYDNFGNLFPGSEIPKWFRYQNDGSSVKINSHGDFKIKGYLLCALFCVHKPQPHLHEYRPVILTCNSSDYAVSLGHSGGGMLDHLWLKYSPFTQTTKHNFHDGFVVEFGPLPHSDQRLEVKRCGVHPIYEEEVDRCSNSVFRNLIEYHQDSVTAAEMDVATTKRCLADYEGAEPNGGGNSDDDEPPSKRHKKLEIY